MSKKEDPTVECALELRDIGDKFNEMYKLGTLLVNEETSQDSNANPESRNKNKAKKPNK